jgi:hypothetical protein
MAAQLPDRVLLNGEYLNLYSNPLEQYWISLNKKKPAFQVFPNCKRGYLADWEIRSEQLFLTGIEGTYKVNFIFFKKLFRYTLKTLFRRSKNKLVKAKWFSGKLRIPLGKMTLYQHAGYDSRFEKELIVTVDKGNVIKTVTLDFTKRTLEVNSIAE